MSSETDRGEEEFMEKEASTAKPHVRQKPLSVLLDEIEQVCDRALKRWERDQSNTALLIAVSKIHGPALVKALRYSIDSFANFAPEAVQIILKQKLTALLNGEDAEEENQNLGE